MMNHSRTASCEPDTPFDLLADPRRRRVIALLRERGPNDRLSLDTLSRRLTEGENAVDGTADALAADLHHRHLPTLDDAGFVEYDPRTHLVKPIPFPIDRHVNDLNAIIQEC